MKAIVLRQPGGPEALVLEDFPAPSPADHEVLVRLKAAALNRRDLLVRSREQYRSAMPLIPGSDGAGIVAAVGAQVHGIQPGDAVVINPALDWGANEAAPCPSFRILGGPDHGTYAELVCVPAENVLPKPRALSFEAAAAFPLACLTAWRALVSKARVQPGEWVLIHGVGGGAGSFAVQIAKLAGARVAVTSHSDEKLGAALAIGADLGINYAHCDWAAELQRQLGGVDVIVDCVGKATFAKGLEALRPGGRLVTFGTTTGPLIEMDIRPLYHKHLTIHGTSMGTPHEFAQMLAAVEAGQINPVVDCIFPLAEAALAHQHMERQEQFGKIVLKIA